MYMAGCEDSSTTCRWGMIGRVLAFQEKLQSSLVHCRVFRVVADEGMLVPLAVAWELSLQSSTFRDI